MLTKSTTLRITVTEPPGADALGLAGTLRCASRLTSDSVFVVRGEEGTQQFGRGVELPAEGELDGGDGAALDAQALDHAQRLAVDEAADGAFAAAIEADHGDLRVVGQVHGFPEPRPEDVRP